LKQKAGSLPVSSYTHLPRHQEIALVFSIGTFFLYNKPITKIPFPHSIPIHVEESQF
jgi:hypothetical protein